ncbi:hypothetical protein L218DRAFT_1082219 [Marasmius fiardii PR-910]|nr:hypothetical protein L218DRAFT_1082219 [Marasmius fiardii PR-910]
MFNNSSHIAITEGTFNYLKNGNQYITYNVHSEPGAQTQSPEDQWKIELYREYKWIPRGESNLLQTICEIPVRRLEHNGKLEDSRGAQRETKTKRVFNVARLGNELDGSQFLSVAYTGLDAKKIFKEDCIAFSQVKHASVAQLHAFNDSDIPTIFFHDQLCPLAHVIQKHPDCQTALLRYLGFQDGLITIESIPEDFRDWEHMWIRARDGTLVYGPEGPQNSVHPSPVDNDVALTAQAHRHLISSPLSVDSYDNQSLLSYLADKFFHGFYWPVSFPTPTPFPFGPFPVNPSLSSDTHLALFSQLSFASPFLRVVARFPELGDDPLWSFRILSPYSHKDQYIPVFMEDGRIRLQINGPLDYSDELLFRFMVDGTYDQRMSFIWLAQACHVFSKLNIPRDDWEDYGFLQCIITSFRPDLHTSQMDTEILDGPYYLFVRPVPRAPNGSPDVASWTACTILYYWSLDSNGRTAMIEKERITRGLPHFIIKATAVINKWFIEDYDFIQELQKVEGFDPTTVNFARSAGLPIVEIVSSEGNRFEDVFDDTVDFFSPTYNHENDGDPMDMESVTPETGADECSTEEISMGIDTEDCYPRFDEDWIDIAMEVDD